MVMLGQRKSGRTGWYQRGEALTIVVIVVVIILIGGLGFILWRQLDQRGRAPQQSGTIQPETTDEANKQPVKKAYQGDWVNTVDGSISVKIPNGWTVYRLQDSPSSLVTPTTGEGAVPTYNAAERPKFETVEGIPTESRLSISVVTMPRQDSGKIESFVLNNGMEGTRSAWSVKADPGNIDGGESDWYYQNYVFRSGNKLVEMHWAYAVPAGTTPDAELLRLIDDVARSIEIK